MNPDVVVVGAGPVGLTMAAELARYGVSVRVVDKAAARTDKSKALVIWSRTLELIDRMGCGASFVNAGWKVTGANIIAGSRAGCACPPGYDGNAASLRAHASPERDRAADGAASASVRRGGGATSRTRAVRPRRGRGDRHATKRGWTRGASCTPHG